MSDNNTENHGGIVIENGTEDLNSGSNRGKLSPFKLLMIMLLAIIIIGGGAYAAFTFIMSHLDLGDVEREKYKEQLNYTDAPDSIGRYIAPDLPIEKEEIPVVEPQPTEDTPPPVIIQQIAETEEVDTGPTLQERRLSAGIQSYSSSNVSTETQREKIPSRQVKLLKNIDYTLIKGTKIPCTMETNIISEQDGFTSCVINQDVYSGNARILLIEKGTKVTGEYRGNVKNGDRRLQIIWDRLITPYDIVVQLASPSTDRLGASGVTGEVDNRWMLRIGSALMVSMIGDALTIAGEKSQQAEVIVESETSEASKSMAEKILEKNIDLPPIVYIREGEMINIYVADDIDLSEVYNVRQTMF